MKKTSSKQAINALFTIIAGLKTAKETEAFLRDLCTIDELEEMARRWEVVRLVADKKPYRKIAEETGLSTATVTRVAHWLKYGKGGYRSALKK